MKGILAQMEENKVINWGIKITKEDISKTNSYFIKAAEKENKNRKELIKKVQKNLEHLKKRSKELNKPIPTYLYYVICTLRTIYVGDEFLETYKEWLK